MAAGCGCGANQGTGTGNPPDGGDGTDQTVNQDVLADPAAETPAPGAEICGDGIDNNLNGYVDERCDCPPGTVQECYPGDPALAGVGICQWGSQECRAKAAGEFGSWGPCAGAVPPGTEICGDGQDNDCDGVADEGCECYLGESRPCYTGPPGTADVGACRSGAEVCVATAAGGTTWGACTGEVLPQAETCDGIDQDCDGVVDPGCLCAPGATRGCYEGPAGTEGVGLCRGGVAICVLTAGGSDWGPCAGWTGPAAESCDGADNDCNGVIDDGCSCTLGATRACYGGAPAERGVGLCRDGMQGCVAAGSGTAWGPCTGEVGPAPDVCDRLDNDCDGVADEGCLCVPGASRYCYTGSAPTRRIGICRDGTETCILSADRTASNWGACTGQTLPATELCLTGLDEDCDGAIDEGCASPPWVTCPAGPITTTARSTITLTAIDGDPDGDIVSRSWTVAAGPPGMIYTFGSPASASTTFRADIAGVYTVRYTVTDSGGRTATCTVEVRVTGVGLRVEVTWSSSTADIDTHLVNGTATQWATALTLADDCHWRNCVGVGLDWPPAGATNNPRLDIDDVNGFGPENINVDLPNLGETYRVGVHWWDGWGSTSSSVTVRIFCGDVSAVPVATYTRTLFGTGLGAVATNDFWKVADVTFSAPDVCAVRLVDSVVPSGPANVPR